MTFEADLSKHYCIIRQRLSGRRLPSAYIRRDDFNALVTRREREAEAAERERTANAEAVKVAELKAAAQAAMDSATAATDTRRRVERIIIAACLMWDVTVPRLRGICRDTASVQARRWAAIRMRDELGMPSFRVGAILNKDHTTVLHMYKAKRDRRRVENRS